MTNSGKILVLGPTGNVGSALIPRLTAMGADVRALVRDESSETSKAQALKDAGVEVFYGDLNNLDTLHAAFKGVAKVFLLTTPGPNGGVMASNAISATKQSGNPHVVNLSVAKATLDHPSRFGREHGESDIGLMESGLPYTFVRAIFFMQNTLPAAQTVASQGTIYMPMKNGKVGMIDARDVAEAVAMVLTSEGHEGKSYLLTGPDSISLSDVAETLSKVLEKEVKYVNVPPEAAKEAILGIGILEWIADLHGNFVEAARRADVGHIVRMSILVAMMPDSPLALSKWHREADQCVIDSGIPYTILQPAYFMQNVLMSAASIASDGIVYGAMGDGKIGVIDTRDIADVAATVLTSDGHEGQSYVLTGPEALSMTDIAAKLSTALSKEVKYLNLSPDAAKAGMVAMGMTDEVADAWVQLAQMVSMGMAEMTTPMVKEILGRDPRSFNQFARDFAHAFKGN